MTTPQAMLPQASSQHFAAVPLLIIGIAWVVAGTLNVAKPDLSWTMRRWQYRNKEAMAPSDTALRVYRVIGVVAIVAGLVMISVSAVTLS